MPIPDTPHTREEMYLNAMATGDSGGIPPVPYTRQEMYLDEIARNGGGGGSTGGGVLVVGVDWDVADGTLNKTWQEIVTFAQTGVVALVDIVDGNGTVKMLASTNINENEYQLFFGVGDSEEFYIASSPNDYPVYGMD